MSEQGKELTTLTPGQQSAEILISQAIEKNVPVETLERLLAMRRELKAEFAKEEFNKAMANFQAECPTIKKTKEVKTRAGVVAYKYAPIESIVEQVKTYLEKNGFSYSTKMEVLPAGVKVTVKATHTFGHAEESSMEVPLGNKTDIMSASQVTAAASTFAKRYAFCNVFGILTGDEDNDGANMASNQNKSLARQTASKKLECARCWQKSKKHTLITPAVADYSQKTYNIKLCQVCQEEAKKFKAKKPIEGQVVPAPVPTAKAEVKSAEPKQLSWADTPGTIKPFQLQQIKTLAKEKLNNNGDDYIIAYIAMFGFTPAKLEDLPYSQAIKVLNLFKNFDMVKPENYGKEGN